MVAIPDTLRARLDAGPLTHLVTLDPDGAPHASAVWVAGEGDDLLVATLFDTPKLRNIRTDQRGAVGEHTLESEFLDPGVEATVFTLG